MSGPDDGTRWALPAPADPVVPHRIQEGPTAIDPDLHAPNERDCQRKPTCRTRTCGNTVLRCPSRIPWPPASPLLHVFSLSFPPSFHVDSPHLLPFLLLSPTPLAFLTERLLSSNSLILFFPCAFFPAPHYMYRGSRGSTRATLKDEGSAGHVGGIAKRSWGLKITFLENGARKSIPARRSPFSGCYFVSSSSSSSVIVGESGLW